MPNHEVNSPIFSKSLHQSYSCLCLFYSISINLLFECKSSYTENCNTEKMVEKKNISVSAGAAKLMIMMAQFNIQ